MSENAVPDVVSAAVRINKIPVAVFGNGVYGEIPSQQVLLNGDIRAEAAYKTGIAVSFLALGSCQGIFFPRKAKF